MSEERYRKGRKISLIIIAGNILLAVLKMSVGFFINSYGLIADGFHSLSDIVSTVIVLIALNISRKPPDEKHHYGHGQAEPIAAKILGIILIFTGSVLAINAARGFFAGQLHNLSLIGFWAAVGSIVIKEIMYRYTYRTGEETNNQALKADAWHHRSDAVSSVAAAIGILGSYLGYPFLDPVAAVIVSFMIIRVGWRITREAINSLMVMSPSEKKITEIVERIEDVRGVEKVADIKAHYSGVDLYIDLKILVDYSITVLEGHQIASRVKRKIFAEYPEAAEVLIHVDPMLAGH